jgi:release factor glutamine methyltransferase
VSNPPYIEAGTIDGLMPEVARYEPRLALDGGPDGLAPYRLIAAAAPQLVVHGGHVLVEMGEGQAIEIASLFERVRMRVGAPIKDLGGIDRVLRATH